MKDNNESKNSVSSRTLNFLNILYKRLQQIKSSHMRFLRSVAGYIRIDKKRNTDIRQNLETFNLGYKIKEEHQNYFEQILKNSNLLNPSENIQLSP
jgi:hypothetical protein